MPANTENLRSPYNAEEPLEGLIKRINECSYFTVEAIEPVSETQLVRVA